MNKEEIRKAKKHYIFTTKHILDDSNKRLKEYIKYLEQKESILDKVTYKLIEDKVKLTEELKYNITKREARLQLILVDKYLNIIEGEKE